MKYSQFLLTAALCLSATLGNAQTTVSYSNGTANRTNGVRFGVGTKQGLAIRISKEKAQLLKGSKINAIEAVFSTSHTRNTTLFITKDLNGAPEVTQAISRTSTRWKSFDLDTPYTITGEEFYVGYTCEVDEAYKPLLFDESQDFGNQLMWAVSNDKWLDVSNKGLGAANLRFVVDKAENFSDVTMKKVDADGFFKTGQGYAFSGQVFNFGTEPIQSFDLTCQIGDTAPSVYSVKDAQIKPGENYDFQMPEYFPTVNGKVPFKVSVSNINGGKDKDESDNLSQTSTYIYPKDTKKMVLIEGFTGQACGNCPNGHKTLEQVLQRHEDNFIEISHHAGYQFDAFTMKEDLEYTWFYNNNGSTYAPASMIDRMPLSDGMGSPVFETQDERLLEYGINLSKKRQPYVDIQLENEYDKTTRNNKVTVTVHTHVLPSKNEHRLNLCLTQNNIMSYQNGAGNNYVHNHVFRGSLNGTWGEVIDLKEGETVVKTYEYTLPDEIESTQSKAKVKTVPEDMNFIAFVSDATESALTCHVYNAATIKMVNDDVTGIEENLTSQSPVVSIMGNQVMVKGEYASAQIFNHVGQSVAQLQQGEAITLAKGFYVVNVIAQNGKCNAQKIYIAK